MLAERHGRRGSKATWSPALPLPAAMPVGYGPCAESPAPDLLWRLAAGDCLMGFNSVAGSSGPVYGAAAAVRGLPSGPVSCARPRFVRLGNSQGRQEPITESAHLPGASVSTFSAERRILARASACPRAGSNAHNSQLWWSPGDLPPWVVMPEFSMLGQWLHRRAAPFCAQARVSRAPGL